MSSSLTLTVRSSNGQHESERTIYVDEDRSREEHQSSEGQIAPDGTLKQTLGPRIAIIRRCDLGRIFSLNLDTAEYDFAPLPAARRRGIRFWLLRPLRMWRLRTYQRPSPTVLVETTTVDTGERKDMFGFTARRVISTTRLKPLAPPSHQDSETTMDGWYIDIDATISCERLPPGSRAFASARLKGEPREVPQFVDIGSRETGYAVDVTSVHVSKLVLPDGTAKTFTRSSRTFVTHLSTKPIDPSLFEVPAAFGRRRR